MIGIRPLRKLKIEIVDTATYDLLTNIDLLHVTYTLTGPVTSLTLSTAQMMDGRQIDIKDAGGNAGTNNITIDTEGSEKIDGLDTFVMNMNDEEITLYALNGNWFNK